MKLLFTSLNSKFIHSNLAIKYLSKCWHEFDVTVEEYTINEDLEQIYFEILDKGYDMVAFSCYIWNIEKTLKLAGNLKKVRPSMLILLGGPEVSYETVALMEENPAIDFVVAGEGEQAMMDLSRITRNFLDISKPERKNGQFGDFVAINLDLLLEIPNLFVRQGEKIFNRATSEELVRAMETQDLSVVPFAYEGETPKSVANKIVYYETSRGCSYNCSYCLSATSKGVRYFGMERVKKELEQIVALGAQQIKFVDRTFNADSGRARELVEFLMQIDDGKINFHFEITAYLLQQELMEVLKNARVGLFQFEIGVQSTNERTLRAVRRANQFAALAKNVKEIQSFGNIHQHLDLIAGLPYEGKERFIQSFNEVFDLQPDALQMGFLKLLKGSPIYNQVEEFDYVFRDYAPYEILCNQFISATELMELKRVEDILDRYYNKGRYKNSMTYLYSFFKQKGYELFEKLLAVIEEHKIDLSKKNEEFFALAKLSESLARRGFCYDFLQELLRLDYLMMGRNPNLPDFLKSERVASKEEIFELLKKEGTLSELGFKEGTPIKEAFKKIQWSNFAYDVLQYRGGKPIKKHNVVLINYDYIRRGDESFPVIRRDYEIKH